MKIKDLIEKLQTVDTDLYVFVRVYEAGYEYASLDFQQKDIALDVHDEWYYGKHDDAREGDEKRTKIVK